MTKRRTRLALMVFPLAFAVSAGADAAQIQTYLALGDSMAFGETDFTHNPSLGDRGYVSLYANSLAAENGGVRPNVINLGVDGETSTTFFQGGPQGNGTLSGQPAPQLNLNYTDPSTTQNTMLLKDIAAEKAAGHNISTVSVQLGANDLFVVVNQPGFFTETSAQQQAAIGQALHTLQANDTVLLTELKTLLPNANILLLGYHNPFNADPTTPIGMLADPAIKALNQLIASEAAAFGARYVDIYKPFLGHELEYTLIAQGNVHPNDKGYAVIASQMQTVPEPNLVWFAALGTGGWIVRKRRRTALVAER